MKKTKIIVAVNRSLVRSDGAKIFKYHIDIHPQIWFYSYRK